MATEKDLEMLDNYLSNKMTEQEKNTFEQRLSTDAALRGEFTLQKEIVEGIRQARIAELKTMLNHTVISGSSGGSSIAIKISLWIAATLIAAGSAYYFLHDEDHTTADNTVVAPAVEPAITPPSTTDDESEKSVVKPSAEKKAGSETDDKHPSTTQGTIKPKQPTTTASKSPVQQPQVSPYDPTAEQDENAGHKPEGIDRVTSSPKVAASTIPVEFQDGDKKFSFHYQFKEGKLVLLGAFEKDLYEILEFIADNKRTVFLYYDDNYYLLDESQHKPTALKAIADTGLINKLRDSRSK